MAHRECMKKYLVQNKLLNCDTCKANFAVGKLSTNSFANLSHLAIGQYFESFLIWLAFSILAGIFILYTTRQDHDTRSMDIWKVVILVLFGFVLGLLGLYAITAIIKELRGLKKIDIEVYCNQTEIAYHNKNSKKILKEFVENMANLPSEEDNESLSIEPEEVEKSEVSTSQRANRSLITEKEKENQVNIEEKVKELNIGSKANDIYWKTEGCRGTKKQRNGSKEDLTESIKVIVHQKIFEKKNLSGIIGEISSIHPIKLRKGEAMKSERAYPEANENNLQIKFKETIKKNLRDNGERSNIVERPHLDATSINFVEENGGKEENETVNEYVEEIVGEKNKDTKLEEVVIKIDEKLKENVPEDETIALDFSGEMKEKDYRKHKKSMIIQREPTLSLSF